MIKDNIAPIKGMVCLIAWIMIAVSAVLFSTQAYAAAIRTSGAVMQLYSNDDSSTGLVSIGFSMNFYGFTASQLYVNNNGCVTLDSPQSTYTPYGLEQTSRIIIAPFFADVDTRNSNNVKYGTGLADGRPAFFVDWINVGYYSYNNSPLNSFQLVLINRSDINPGDFDIEFNYDTIGWETGDASGGDGGLGGNSARVGFSCGTQEAGKYYEFPGSGVNGAFLDNGPYTLAGNRHNSSVLGRHVFKVRNGTVNTPSAVAITGVLGLLLGDTNISGELDYYLNGYSALVTDYPASDTNPRSPRHVLSMDDELNFEFRGTPNKPNFFYQAKVQSSSSATFVSFYLVESSTPGVYRNPLPIHLSTSDTHSSSRYTVKFQDEDILTTTITSAEGTTTKSVMLDKGEYASCGIAVFFPDATTVKNGMENLDWAQAGYAQYSDFAGDPSNPHHTAMQNFIKNAGSNLSSMGEADFLHFTSHGDYDGWLYDDSGIWGLNVILKPTDIDLSQDLNQDVEWIFINACNTLNHSSAGRDRWMDILAGATKPVHGLLGYDEPVSADLSSQIASFIARLGQSETYMNAFYNAMTSGFSDEPCAMAAHEENLWDKLNFLTQDSTGNLYRYYWYDVAGWGGTLYSETIIKSADGIAIRSAVNLESVPAPDLRPMVMKRKDFGSPPKGYGKTMHMYGLTVLDHENNALSETHQDEYAAMIKASTGLERAFGPIPDDASGPEIGSLRMQRYTWEGGSIPTGPEIAVARTVQYTHYINGVPVIGDILAATVTGNRITKLKGSWHEPVASKMQTSAPEGRVMPARNALGYALSGLRESRAPGSKSQETVGNVFLQEAELCYYGFQDSSVRIKTFLPAWRFRFNENNRLKNIYVDAVSGDLHSNEEVTNAMRRIN